MDFTPNTYQKLLISLKKSEYSFFTFEEYCFGKAVGKYVIIRHDIDRNPEQALAFAQLENKLGVKSTYYFLTSKQIFIPTIITQISKLGHEIGYHYRDLVDVKGNYEKAIETFQCNLSKLRTVIPIKTIAMDGCPRSKQDNRDIWKNYNYHDFGIIGEPYFDFLNREDILYFTDTGRMWDGDKYNIRDKAINKKEEKMLPKIHSTADLISWIEATDNQLPMMINTHPQRWTNNKLAWWKELITQSIKNQIKVFINQ